MRSFFLSPTGARRARQGFTLLELTVALVVTAVVIGTATALGAKLQRFHRELAIAGDRLDQVDQTAALLAVDLRALAPGEGDLTSGEARDTSLQFRATIGSSVVCDVVQDRVSLAPVGGAGPALSAFLTPPSAGDTVWALSTGDTSRWTPWTVTTVGADAGRCLIAGVDAAGNGPPASRVALTLTGLSAAGGMAVGTPVRITRLARYSLYHAADGEWYLGERDWNAASARFNAIQPVSGPFLSSARAGLAFRYQDSLGTAVASGAVDTRSIALIRGSPFQS